MIIGDDRKVKVTHLNLIMAKTDSLRGLEFRSPSGTFGLTFSYLYFWIEDGGARRRLNTSRGALPWKFSVNWKYSEGLSTRETSVFRRNSFRTVLWRHLQERSSSVVTKEV